MSKQQSTRTPEEVTKEIMWYCGKFSVKELERVRWYCRAVWHGRNESK